MLTCLVGTEDAVKLPSCILTATHSSCDSLMLNAAISAQTGGANREGASTALAPPSHLPEHIHGADMLVLTDACCTGEG